MSQPSNTSTSFNIKNKPISWTSSSNLFILPITLLLFTKPNLTINTYILKTPFITEMMCLPVLSKISLILSLITVTCNNVIPPQKTYIWVHSQFSSYPAITVPLHANILWDPFNEYQAFHLCHALLDDKLITLLSAHCGVNSHLHAIYMAYKCNLYIEWDHPESKHWKEHEVKLLNSHYQMGALHFLEKLAAIPRWFRDININL